MKNVHLSTAILVAGAIGLAAGAKADLAFDSFSGYGYDFSTFGGWIVAGSNSLAPTIASNNQFASEQIADEFTAGLGGSLTELDLAVALTSADTTSDVVATLYTSSASDTLGTAVGSWSDGTQLVAPGSSGSVLAFSTAGSDITLRAGAKYWVMLSGASQQTLASWSLANGDTPWQKLLIRNGSADHYQSSGGFAFNVHVKPPAPTPEPFTLGLSLMGLCLAGRRFAQRRRS